MTLSGSEVQQIARNTAQRLPGAGHGHPFTPRLDVYKVAGKVFMIVTDDPGELIVTVKIDPEHGSALQRTLRCIRPGRYLDKRHWTTIGAGPGITRDLVEDLVTGSYELVVEKIPPRRRPPEVQNALGGRSLHNPAARD